MREIKSGIKASIMVVDDSVESLECIADGLRQMGHEVRPVPRGKLALQAAVNSPPDLILLDVMMPDMDGFQVCQELKANPSTKHIPIIFITALDYSENEQRGLKLGAVDYISKPVDINILCARVNTQLKIKLQRDQLERQKESLLVRNEELEAFAYTASHDLKAPLSIIRTYSAFIKEHFEETNNETGLEDINEIIEASNNMINLIESLLMLSNIGNQKLVFEKIDVTALVQLIIQDSGIKKTYRAVDFIIEEGLVLYGDMELFKIAFVNLIQNACKYSYDKENPIVEVGSYDDLGEILFVKDNGIGLDMTLSDMVFKPFFRADTNSEVEGTGIGLSIVRRIIDKHNGEIWFESEPGVGTTFYIKCRSESSKARS